MNNPILIPNERIVEKIYLIRGKKVMLASDIAEMYGVETRILNQAVHRNHERFPSDFMFKLTLVEAKSLTSQFVMSNVGRGGSRWRPLAFTEQGVAMLSCVLSSPRAIAVSIQIIRTFTRLRELMLENRDLRLKLEAMEARYDKSFKIVFDAIRRLLRDDATPSAEIGFKS